MTAQILLLRDYERPVNFNDKPLAPATIFIMPPRGKRMQRIASPFLMRVLPTPDAQSKTYFGGGFGHWCPACKQVHIFATEFPQRNGAIWKFDGHLHRPTFSPSMRVHWENEGQTVRCCHYFLKAGMLEFLSDCTHALAGHTVPLPELPEEVKGKSDG